MELDIEALKTVILALCKEQGITINKLAKLSGLTQSTIDGILKNHSKNPTVATISKIASGFGLSQQDFLSMVEGIDNLLNPKEFEPKSFPARFKHLRTHSCMTKSDLAHKLQISPASVNAYETGLSQPNLDTLIKISCFFDVSADYLLGLSDEPKRR